jgi:hypothetical protein
MLYESIRTDHADYTSPWVQISLAGGNPPYRWLTISSERSLVSGISESLV